MKTYLLKAPDEDMERWKAQAKADGAASFAAWVRYKLDTPSHQERSSAADPSLTLERRERQAAVQPTVRPSLMLGEKKTYNPDPKPVKEKKR